MRGSDRDDRDRVVPLEGSRSTGGNHDCRSKSHPYGLRPRGFPHQDSGYTGNTEQMVWKMWGTVHGNLPRLHDGGFLVLCETQGCLCCEVCERETDISGDWIDGTRLVDDSLSLNYHDMGSFLISEVRGVRLAGSPSSDAPHDRLEFKGIVRGWQPEE